MPGPVLHVGADDVGVRVRPLADDLARLTFERPLPVTASARNRPASIIGTAAGKVLI